MMTQKQKIKYHLETYGKITSMQAFSRYRITRLSARIYDLRQDGMNIINNHIRKKNLDGEPSNYDEYILVR